MAFQAMSFEVTETSLHVGGKTYKMHHNVYVVGFGKAALGMARAVDDMIGDHIVKGIVSIPFGSINDYKKYERGYVFVAIIISLQLLFCCNCFCLQLFLFAIIKLWIT